MRASLTETQQEVYAFIVHYIRKNRYSPTLRDIKEHFGYRATNSVSKHVTNLIDKGYIKKSSTKDNTRTRTIQLVDDIIGNYTIDTAFLKSALKKMKKNKYKLDANTAIEFLKELNVKIV